MLIFIFGAILIRRYHIEKKVFIILRDSFRPFMMGKDKDKHLSKGSRETGEASSPQKEANDNKVPGKEHQPRGSG